MSNELFRNGSGYADITAYKAIINVERKNNMEFKRGEIFEYNSNAGTRKALIVSANYRKNNFILSAICLIDEERDGTVPILCGTKMFADCEKVFYTQADRFGNYLRTATAKEMERVDEELCRTLGIEPQVVEKEVVKPIAEVKVDEKLMEKNSELTTLLNEANTKAGIFENLYKDLLAKVMKG